MQDEGTLLEPHSVGEHNTFKVVNLKATSNTDSTRIEKVIIKL